MTVGKTPFTLNTDDITPYILPMSKELDMVFQFQLMQIDAPHNISDSNPIKDKCLVWMEWKLSEMKTVVQRWQGYKRDEGYWNVYGDLFLAYPADICIIHSIYIENHDQVRSVSHFGNNSDEYHFCPNASHLPDYTDRYLIRVPRRRDWDEKISERLAHRGVQRCRHYQLLEHVSVNMMAGSKANVDL
jgi:glycosidase